MESDSISPRNVFATAHSAGRVLLQSMCRGICLLSARIRELRFKNKKETNTGITTNFFIWTTKNPYGKDVRLNLFSSPSSEILVEKNVGRIGGYDYRSEVYSPVIWFRTPATTSAYRVTALLSSYTSEIPKTAQEIAVKGRGHALKVSSSSVDDYIYTGSGISSFDTFTTDADSTFVRNSEKVSEFTILNGSFLKQKNNNLVTISRNVDYFTFKQEGKTVKFIVKGQNDADIYLYGISPLSITRDGNPFNAWTMEPDGTALKISTDLSDHEFEIFTDDVLSIIPVMNQSVNERSRLTFTIKTFYTGSGSIVFSAGDLPRNATFDAGKRTFTWTPGAGESGFFEPTFSVTDGMLSDSETVVIAVTPKEDSIGIFHPSSGYWYFDNNLDGEVDASFRYGGNDDRIIRGDWDGDGKDGIAIFRPTTGYWYFDNNLDGRVDTSFRYGGSDDRIIQGDWDGDGKDGIAIFRPTTGYWYFDNNLDGNVDTSLRYGGSDDRIIRGDWDGDRKDGIAIFRPSSGYWYFDNNLDGNVDKSLRYGSSDDRIIAGKWV